MSGETVLVLMTALVVLATAVVGFMSKLKQDVKEIHVMVNSRLLAEQDWNDKLSEALKAAGIDVPSRPKREEGLQ